MSETGLRAFLHAANESERECLAEYKDLVTFLDKIDLLFRKFFAGEIAGHPLPWMLFLNAHASFLAAVRIALSGQAPPTHMVLRGAMESALFALIASCSEENRAAWLDRDKDRRRSRKIYNAHDAIKLLKDDPGLFQGVSEAYDLAIDFGAHPNLRSVVDHVSFKVTDEGYPVTLAYLHGAPSTQGLRAVAACIEIGLFILFISPHAFPNVDKALNVHTEASDLRKEFDRFAQEAYSDEDDQAVP
jgi:hypothetical protein